MRRHTTQENLMHRHSLFEDSQVFTARKNTKNGNKCNQMWKRAHLCNDVFGWGSCEATFLHSWLVATHASSSCFILVNSSLVMEPSPSPSFCSFSLEASKSGLGGAGGIWRPATDLHRVSCANVLICFWFIHKFPLLYHSTLTSFSGDKKTTHWTTLKAKKKKWFTIGSKSVKYLQH